MENNRISHYTPPEPSFLLQACKFVREEPPTGTFKKDVIWEYGFARVPMFGMHDVKWIIDRDGKLVDNLWDYHLIDGSPGCYAQV